MINSPDAYGYNLFAYCGNDPVNNTDPSGYWPQWIKDAANWVDNNIVKPVVKIVNGVIEDYNNYDESNTSEEKVFESNYFSSYKGVPVVRLPIGKNSFSYGAIFLGDNVANRDDPIETVRHEYGHTVQFDNMGIVDYTVDVGIPSVTLFALSSMEKLPYEYYSYPWEAEADELGGVINREYTKPALPSGAYNSYLDLVILFFD